MTKDDQTDPVELEGSEPIIEENQDVFSIPSDLPILPLRGLVVYPYTAVPLLVGQPRSIRLVDEVMRGEEQLVGLFTSFDPDNETPAPDDIRRVGTAAVIHRIFRAPDGTIRLLVQGLERIEIEEYTQEDPFLQARVTAVPEDTVDGLEVEALVRNISEQFERLSELAADIPSEMIGSTLDIEDPLQLVYAVATYTRMDVEDAQHILALDGLLEKMYRLVALLEKELEVLELGQKIRADAQSEIDKVQREYFLKEQMKAIQRELGEADSVQGDVEAFRRRIQRSKMPAEARKEAMRELERLSRLPSAAAEYGVIRTYLDTLTSLPWGKTTKDHLDIAHARTVLDEDHYGLDEIKERILEFLAVRKLRADRAPKTKAEKKEAENLLGIRREREGVILCFVGPPGVGKTSLGASIARAMGRKFIRMSLGGVRDEAEIRGHRRTYIGSMPGRIIQALRRSDTRNPVIMLDEIDKLGADFRGDPASALLEVLDPEQNAEFRDHYLEIPFDLSQVFFITTANVLDQIPGPLRDRMEILRLTGYTENEKVKIAQSYLVPRQVAENGLVEEEISFTDEAILAIIRDFTREAGVRNLEREIGAVCRKVVTRIAEGKIESMAVDHSDVAELLGKPKYYPLTELEERTRIPGVATGLVWTPVGGDVVFVEATQMPGKKGFMLTGQLGDVMKESAQAALSYVRSHIEEFDGAANWYEEHDLHLHVPAGAVPKDGPSAGITMVTALSSLITQRLVRSDVAMTGEITLRGQVLPVGGIKEKVLAAHRFDLSTVIMPSRNEKDLDDLPDEVRKALTFVMVDSVEEVLEVALEPMHDGAAHTHITDTIGETARAKSDDR